MDGLKGTLCEKPWFLALNVWALQICLKNLKALLGWRKLQCNQVAVWLSGSLGSGADVGLKKIKHAAEITPLESKDLSFWVGRWYSTRNDSCGVPLQRRSTHHQIAASFTHKHPAKSPKLFEHHQIIQQLAGIITMIQNPLQHSDDFF